MITHPMGDILTWVSFIAGIFGLLTDEVFLLGLCLFGLAGTLLIRWLDRRYSG